MPLAQKPIASPFGHGTQALEVVRGIDLKGKTAIVTGGSSGLGIETARALAQAGARVILPVRSRQAGEDAAADIRGSTGNAAVGVADMDLGDWASVRAFADSFRKTGQPLHLLINNAGIMATPERRIMGNVEAQFGTNHLGHMLLTCSLAAALLKGAPARVVCLTSLGHRIDKVSFDDPNFLKSPYNKWQAYGRSKSANALFALELNRRLEGRRVNAYSVHPGGIMTNLQRDMPAEEIKAMGWIDEKTGRPRDGFKTPAGGAATAVWCATSPLLSAGGGVYCEDCNIAEPVPADSKAMSGVRPWVTDPEAGRRLWTMSEEMLGETFAL